MRSAHPPIPHLHSPSIQQEYKSRAHANPTSLSSVHGGTLSSCPVFYGCLRVFRPEGVGGAILSDPETAEGEREDKVQRGAYPGSLRQGSVT